MREVEATLECEAGEGARDPLALKRASGGSDGVEITVSWGGDDQYTSKSRSLSQMLVDGFTIPTATP